MVFDPPNCLYLIECQDSRSSDFSSWCEGDSRTPLWRRTERSRTTRTVGKHKEPNTRDGGIGVPERDVHRHREDKNPNI